MWERVPSDSNMSAIIISFVVLNGRTWPPPSDLNEAGNEEKQGLFSSNVEKVVLTSRNPRSLRNSNVCFQVFSPNCVCVCVYTTSGWRNVGCFFFYVKITIIQSKIILFFNLFPEVQVHFSSSFCFSKESVFQLVMMNLLMCTGEGYEKHYSMYLLHFVIWVLLFLFLFCFCLSQESRKAVNFILRHCTVNQSCKYFTSTKKKKQPNNMFCSFTTNNKKILFSSILVVFPWDFLSFPERAFSTTHVYLQLDFVVFCFQRN